MLDLLAVPEQQSSSQHDQWQGDAQDPNGPSHGIIGDNLGWFFHVMMLVHDFHDLNATIFPVNIVFLCEKKILSYSQKNV